MSLCRLLSTLGPEVVSSKNEMGRQPPPKHRATAARPRRAECRIWPAFRNPRKVAILLLVDWQAELRKEPVEPLSALALHPAPYGARLANWATCPKWSLMFLVRVLYFISRYLSIPGRSLVNKNS